MNKISVSYANLFFLSFIKYSQQVPEALYAVLFRNMLERTEDNYLNYIEPIYEPRTSVIWVRRGLWYLQAYYSRL